MRTIKKAFTLVELIVVIVILAILATIAFLSFSSQSASARDSTRLSDMNNIAKGLSVFNATSGNYPKPDNSIILNASGATISFQGYAGSSVLNMIKISNGGKDPLDKSTYYTYSTNSNQSKFQIMGFLEDGSSSALSLSPDFAKSGLKSVFADSSSYSGRYIITKGDMIGILLQSGTLLPIQSPGIVSGTGIDIINSTSVYTMQFDNKTKVTGSGTNLKSGIAGGGLVGYWPFDEGTGTGVADKNIYTYSNNAAVIGGNPKWKQMGLCFNTNDYIGTGTGFDIDFSNGNYTFSFNLYYSGAMPTNTSRIFQNLYISGSSRFGLPDRWTVIDLGISNGGSYFEYEGGLQSTGLGGKFLNSNGMFYSPLTEKTIHTISFIISKNGTTAGYLDGSLVSINNNSSITKPGADLNSVIPDNIFLTNKAPFLFGNFYGPSPEICLSNFRIYNRGLSNDEIKTLYTVGK